MSALAASVRLVKGDHSNGILQVYSRYRFRTVCGTGFDNADAAVACKDLGFQHGRALPTGKVHVHFRDELNIISYLPGKCFIQHLISFTVCDEICKVEISFICLKNETSQK